MVTACPYRVVARGAGRRLPSCVHHIRGVPVRLPTPNEIAERALTKIAAGQRSVFTHAQAIGAGWTDQRIGRRLRAGRVERLHRGVYAFAGSPDTWERAVVAAILAAGRG